MLGVAVVEVVEVPAVLHVSLAWPEVNHGGVSSASSTDVASPNANFQDRREKGGEEEVGEIWISISAGG